MLTVKKERYPGKISEPIDCVDLEPKGAVRSGGLPVVCGHRVHPPVRFLGRVLTETVEDGGECSSQVQA